LQEILRAAQPARVKLTPEDISGYSDLPIPSDDSANTDTTLKVFARI
jgi:hypothetical protein